MGGTAHHADVGHVHAEGYARFVDDYHVHIVINALESHEFAGAFGDFHCLHTLCSAACDAICLERCALAGTGLREHHYSGVGIVFHSHQTHYGIALLEGHAADTGADTAHRAQVAFVEADSTAGAVGKENLGVAVGEFDTHQSVAGTHENGLFAFGHHTGVFS